MKAIMKAISSRRSLNSSAVRNSLAYVMRAKRISAPGTDTRLGSLDTIKRVSKCWDTWGNRKVYITEDYDRLQYVLAFSNNNLHQNPDDIFSLAKGKAVTAENMWEEAEEYSKMAEKCRKKAETLRHNATMYNCSVYREYAAIYEEDAEYYDGEARRYCDWATEQEKAAEYFQYEAENMVKEEAYVSGWESWLDM